MGSKRLYSPVNVKEILNRHGFRFTKSLGQNFLIDGNVVRNIVEESAINQDDYVLEIGPGIGTLTEELASKAKKVVAIEIDKSLGPILDETLDKYNNLEVVFGDVLEIDLNKLINEKFGGGPVKVVANLPYYITTPIIGRLLEEDLNIRTITVMVQKEVADRIVSKPGSKDYSSLSVFINFYTEPEVVLQVPRAVFMPQPNVDSAVVKLKLKDQAYDIERDKFFKVVKASFAMRRKTLLNCLSKGEFSMDKDRLKVLLEEIGINPSIRAENLSVEDFISITENIR